MEKKQNKIQLFLAGDSTVANCPPHESPMAGWGQVVQSFFSEEVEVRNAAMGGRSSNSFIEEGRLTAILEEIQPGDYLFIQFGHNDQKSYGTEPFTTYKEFLTQYVMEARRKGANPVFLTSVNRRNFNDDGELQETLGDYPKAMRELAEKLDVPLIDLTAKTKVLYESLGPEESKKLFVWFKENEHPNYPTGIQDDTHFCETGAYEICKLVIEGIRELGLSLSPFINDSSN